MAEPQRNNNNRRRDRNNNENEEQSDLVEKLVSINRVSKTVKGGRTMRFSALVVVGDRKGKVGMGHGKAREVPEAIDKATKAAKRQLFRVPMREGRTLHHDLLGRFGAGKVVLRAAPPGTGIIAGGPMRALLEVLGIGDVVSKSIGTSNPHNMVRATMDALKQASSPRQIAARRGIKMNTLSTGGKANAKAGAETTDAATEGNEADNV